MMDKYYNKYRIPSARANWWNYGWSGAYFITICTNDRNHYFGEIIDGKMIKSHVGVLADVLWYEMKNHAKNIELGAFIVMPNHIHGILILDHQNKLLIDNESSMDNNVSNSVVVQTRHALSPNEQETYALSLPNPNISDTNSVQTRHALSLPISESQKRFRNPGKNTVSSIIGGYKSAVSKHANRLGFDFAWQSRFHDHIIRNDDEYQRINDYIENNPQKWNDDELY